MSKKKEVKRGPLAEVGKRIKIARKARGIQQKVAAEALGVSPSHLSEIEAGKSNPSTDFHLRLSDLYNISVEYIFHGRGKMFYDEEKPKEEEFDLSADVDSLEKLMWLAKNSHYFKMGMLLQATKFLHTDMEHIKISFDSNKSK